MSNIGFLKRDALARRACGWHYGADELPLDPITLAADALAEVSAPNVCPYRDPDCLEFCARPQVCGGEPE